MELLLYSASLDCNEVRRIVGLSIRMTQTNLEMLQRINQLARRRLSRYFLNARHRSGFKLEFVQEVTGVDVQSLEDGTSSFPLDEIEKLARFYNIPIPEFMEWLTRLDLEIQKIRSQPSNDSNR